MGDCRIKQMRGLITKLWVKTRPPLFIATLCFGSIGWTTAYWLWQPIRTEASQVWQEHLQRQLNKDNGIGDSVKAQEEQKTESYVPTDGSELHYVDSREMEVQEASSPTPSAIENKILQKFGDDGKIALAIAKAESHLNPQAIGDGHLAFNRDGIEYGKSYGVFQIRFLEGRPNPNELLDPDKNIAYAYELYQKSGFSPWSQYKNGAYLKYL